MASGVSFIYASSEKNRMLACRFGEHRDNSRNSQSVFLVVALYNGTPVYNFINDRLADESAVLRPLS